MEKTGQLALRVRNVCESLGITQQELSVKLGLSGQTLTNNLSKGRAPEPHVCLMLAGLDAEGREFWMKEAGITEEQLGLIANALAVPTTGITDLMAHPRNEQERLLARLIRQVVLEREVQKER